MNRLEKAAESALEPTAASAEAVETPLLAQKAPAASPPSVSEALVTQIMKERAASSKLFVWNL